MTFLADLAPLDVSRCYDGFRCPMYAHCLRTEPVPPNVFVSQSMFYALSRERGGCEFFIDRGER